MAWGIWSTDSVADSRTGTDVRFGRGESTRERGWSMARGIWVNGLCHGITDGSGREARSHLFTWSTSTGEMKQCENMLTTLEILLALC